MIYYKIEKVEDQLYIIEKKLDQRYTLKTETNFSQCNGFLGVRAAFETSSLKESRGMFVAGFYHKAGKYEATELINCPDLVGMEISISGEEFHLDTCKINSFERKLNVRTGELVTAIHFDLDETKDIEFKSRKFVSMKNRHLLCHQIEIKTGSSAELQIITGINGQITNSGVSHFIKAENRVFDKKYMYTRNICDDDQLFEAMTVCSADNDVQSPVFQLKRRSIFGNYRYTIAAGEKFCFTKYSYIDAGTMLKPNNSVEMMADLKQCELLGYDAVLEEHVHIFNKLWSNAAIQIKGASLEEEAAIAFAQYHLFGMVPYETADYSVPAKGLTGEGYKGHVFWDTEIFVMPFFTTVFPEVARNILMFRYQGLAGAKEKAEQYDYLGAMYPWEVARTGGEETPLYAALNIHTGEAERVWSGIKEHHITADIIYALWDYYKHTGDEEFLLRYGYEMIIETAMFWCSRASYNTFSKQFEILDIIGPDEYTEHVDNNAYTNYMAKENVQLAYDLISVLQEKNPELYHTFMRKYKLEKEKIIWRQFIDHIYLPLPNEVGIIPQDDTFLSKKVIENIETYRNSSTKQSILLDYSRDEVVNMQILKQADIVMLLNLIPQLFDKEIIKENVRFYENRTVHDSSLSYCAHAIASAGIGDIRLAYEFFLKAMEIDLNDNYSDTTDGIHAAALGGIWNSVILGFAGVKFGMDCIEITPHLPDSWEEMRFKIKAQGQFIRINIQRDKIQLEAEEALTKELEFTICGNTYLLKNNLVVNLNEVTNKN